MSKFVKSGKEGIRVVDVSDTMYLDLRKRDGYFRVVESLLQCKLTKNGKFYNAQKEDSYWVVQSHCGNFERMVKIDETNRVLAYD